MKKEIDTLLAIGLLILVSTIRFLYLEILIKYLYYIILHFVIKIFILTHKALIIVII